MVGWFATILLSPLEIVRHGWAMEIRFICTVGLRSRCLQQYCFCYPEEGRGKMLRWIRPTVALFIVLVPVMLAVPQTPRNVPVNDDSDWWSIIRTTRLARISSPKKKT
jgi:hypothetical protein